MGLREDLAATIPEGAGIHGVSTDNPFLKKLLDLGNYLRYGKSEGDRVEAVNRLSTPGVKDAAYTGPMHTFDPAAAERYTSAYELGQRFHVPEALQPLVHAISGGGRKGMHALGIPGVGPERSELTSAEEMGMARGARSNYDDAFREALAGMMARGGR